MKVLFVAKELKMEPLGVMYLIDALKRAGHEASLARCDSPPEPESVVAAWRPDFVCYSVCSGLEDFYLGLDVRLSQVTDRQFQSVFGGPAVTFNPVAFTDCDHFVRGEGERAVVDVVEGRVYGDLRLVDVAVLPVPDRSELYKYADLRNNPIKNVITRRGCVGGCHYCFNREWNRLHKGQLPKGVVRYRSVDSVVEEGMQLKALWPLELVNFVDDNFVSSRGWLAEFAKKWPAEVRLPFFCSVRPDDVEEEDVRLLSRAGCKIANMAVESANQRNRREVLGRTGDKERAVRAVDMFRRAGIRTRLQNIIGLPVVDPMADAVETLRFNLRAKPTSSWCALLQAYRGTRVHEIASEGGYIDPDNDGTDQEFFGHSTLRIRDRRKIERLHKLWPVLTAFPRLNWLRWLLVRLPLPYSWFKWFFGWTKRWLAERDLWQLDFGRDKEAKRA